MALNRMLERDDVKFGYKIGAGSVGVVGKKLTVPLYLAPALFRNPVAL